MNSQKIFYHDSKRVSSSYPQSVVEFNVNSYKFELILFVCSVVAVKRDSCYFERELLILQ